MDEDAIATEGGVPGRVGCQSKTTEDFGLVKLRKNILAPDERKLIDWIIRNYCFYYVTVTKLSIDYKTFMYL